MKTIRRLPVAVAALCAVMCADAADAQSGVRARIQREILEKQKKMREGNVVRANVRVTVRLNNGSRLSGVVKDGRFIERPDRVAFVEVDVKSEKSGLRLWYSNNTNSYIFLPYHSIKRYRIGEKLTDAAVEEIAQRIDESRRQAALRRAEQFAKKQKDASDQQAADTAAEEARSESSDVVATPAKPAAEPAPSKLTASQQALLQEFPPAQGWSLDKLQTLERRKTTIGVFPNEKEAKFIDNFAAWNEAHEVWSAEQEAPKSRGGSEQPKRIGGPGPNQTGTPKIPQPMPTSRPY